MTRTMESFARVARWPYAGSPPKTTNSLTRSSMSARDPSGLPNGPTGSSRRRLLPIFAPIRIVAARRSKSHRENLHGGTARPDSDDRPDSRLGARSGREGHDG